MSEILYYRGDSYPLVFTLANAKTGLPIDLTGCTLTLTVSTDKNPTSDDNKVFDVIGEVDSDPTTGKVAFTPSVGQTAIVPKKYYYDVQLVDALMNVRTIVKSTFTITQDITK